MSRERTVNLLGTVSLLLVDEQLDAIERATGLGPSAAAALTTIGHAPGEPIEFLRRALRRTHSSVVRLVAGLVDAGRARRGSHADGRRVDSGGG